MNGCLARKNSIKSANRVGEFCEFCEFDKFNEFDEFDEL